MASLMERLRYLRSLPKSLPSLKTMKNTNYRKDKLFMGGWPPTLKAHVVNSQNRHVLISMHADLTYGYSMLWYVTQYSSNWSITSQISQHNYEFLYVIFNVLHNDGAAGTADCWRFRLSQVLARIQRRPRRKRRRRNEAGQEAHEAALDHSNSLKLFEEFHLRSHEESHERSVLDCCMLLAQTRLCRKTFKGLSTLHVNICEGYYRSI